MRIADEIDVDIYSFRRIHQHVPGDNDTKSWYYSSFHKSSRTHTACFDMGRVCNVSDCCFQLHWAKKRTTNKTSNGFKFPKLIIIPEVLISGYILLDSEETKQYQLIFI